MFRIHLALAAVLSLGLSAKADTKPVFHLDFAREESHVKLMHGAKRIDGALEFNHHLQYAEVPLSKKLDGIRAISIGCWVYPRRTGEQYFLFRGLPEIALQGERMFRPNERWVNCVLGTDERGFFLATSNGNGTMPFPHVTLNAVPINSWSHLVYVKDEKGFQTFFMNGVAVHSDRDSAWGGKVHPFRDIDEGDSLRLAVPLGGRLAEASIHSRELSAAEIRADFQAKKGRYKPSHEPKPVALREMDPKPASGLWDERGERMSQTAWPRHRERILQGVSEIIGPMPKEKVPLDAKVLLEEDCGTYVRRKVSIQVQPRDQMPAYLLVPKKLKGRVPAIVCFYGTTSGAGKETTVGLSGGKPGTPPERNRSFAIDMAEAGFVAFAADYLRDGERLPPSGQPYDTTDFYKQFPDWSIHGKDAWDTMRAIDYLQSLDFVDPDQIAMVGHSYGGHSTIFTTALEPRIKAAWANGPVSDFRQHGMHWGVPKGAGNSQSMPALRPYVLDHTLRIPVTFYEFTSLIAPRPLVVAQAVGERRPMEEENYAAVREVYQSLGAAQKVKYLWYPGDHDFPPAARKAAVDWFRQWLGEPKR